MAENNSMIETQEENSSQKNTQEDADLLAEVQNDDSSLNLGNNENKIKRELHQISMQKY